MATRVAFLSMLVLLATGAVAPAQDFGPSEAETLRSVETCLASAKDDPRRCIGKASDKCTALPGAETTEAIDTCLESERAAWDTILNRNYKAAMKAAEEKDRELSANYETDIVSTLKAAQRAWIAYRDAECDRVFAFWKDGTIRTSQALSCQRDLTGARAIELAATED
ncbi:lysozyme inhibitor LprI family protein [Aureimonas sp. AU4]|uniref:lysozyme inhibitor LprI family protein n=1 Tax=Aureimonas sp. AU4 TaxID=1638163 RepID=UPI000783AE35|nr:lysozyme inhibitor LprI family protein [Aureimonas sp. AU4]